MGFAPPKSYELHRDGKVLAIAQEVRGTGSWFWYGDGINTANRPAALEEVKTEATDHFRLKAAEAEADRADDHCDEL